MQSKEKQLLISPGAAAVIMAIGIFLLGAVEAISLIQPQVEYYFVIGLLILWCIVYGLLSIQSLNLYFIKRILVNKITSFLIGTWIAGVSVLCHVLLKYFPDWLYLIRLIASINVVLAFPFLIVCMRNILQLYKNRESKYVHGVLLLSTVGIQSIVLLWNAVFFIWPVWLSKLIVIIGLLFYVLGLILIMKRYLQKDRWSLIYHWENTNCIIHGALSITGFAIVVTKSFSAPFTISLWIITFCMLLLIEGIEVVRAVKRVNTLGFREGLCTYHTSQWARNFTFGMFYVFTNVLEKSAYQIPIRLISVQKIILVIWAWIVFIVLVAQIVVFLYDVLQRIFSKNRGISYFF